MSDRSLLLESLIAELKNFLTEEWYCSSISSLHRHVWNVGSWRKIINNFGKRGDLEVLFSHVGSDEGNASEKSSFSLLEGYVEVRSHDEDMDDLVARNIVEESGTWLMRIKECTCKDGRVIIKLLRDDVFKVVLRSVHSRGLNYGALGSRGEVIVISTDHIFEDCDLSLRRLALTAKVSSRILEKLGYTALDGPGPTECGFKLFFTLNPALRDSNMISFVCGVVRNSKDHKKEVCISAGGYQRLRERDIRQASIHKYGSSALQPPWEEFVASLAHSAVTVDLLCTKPSRPISLDLRDEFVLCREKSSKGSTFLLYNYARLVSILKQFEEKVAAGVYPPLVPLEDADFSLLSSEEEWMLVYGYLLPYPSLLAQLVKPKEPTFDLHVLLKFSQDLCKCLSAYYSRVHILTEPRKHLLPLMYSRLHLISGIRLLMQNIFILFDIRPVSQM